MFRKQKGFTLIELLVVISIIGVLSTIAMTSLNGARAKARDARRKIELNQIYLAFEQYYFEYGTFIILGTGSSGEGKGWFNYEDVSDHYLKSIATGLEEAGYFTNAPRDPSLTSDSQFPQYMVYTCNEGIYIFAHLENPSASDLATYEGIKNAGCDILALYGVSLDSYGMNFGVGGQSPA